MITYVAHQMGTRQVQCKSEFQHCSIEILCKLMFPGYICVSVSSQEDRLCLSSSWQAFHLCNCKKTTVPNPAILLFLKIYL